MILKKLFIGIIFLWILVLNMPFILGVIYNFDMNGDGTPEEDSTNLALPIYWRIGFEAYGAESGTNLPNLSVTGTDTFDVTIPANKFTGSNPDYHAAWGWLSERCTTPTGSLIDCSVGPIGRDYYVFQHYPSTKHYTSLRILFPGTYNLSAIAYGNGLNPSGIEPASTWWALWSGKPCPVPITNPVACRNPPCPPGYNEYIESVFNPYCTVLGGPSICPVCNNNPNSCTEYLSPNAYLCNGIHVEIELVDNLGFPVKTISMDNNWAKGDQVAYVDNYEGVTFITDSTPGIVNISQTIIVTQGCTSASECADNICYEPVCTALGECDETLVAQGGNDEGCVLPNRCDGAGNCVRCNQASDCGTDGLLNSFQCNGFSQIQQKYRTYSCISNTCSYTDSWQNDGTCTFPNVCYNPLSAGDCCVCPALAQCGCGGGCGVCSPGTTCNGNTCELNGNAYWANMNGEKIGDGTTQTNSEIGDSVLLIYQNQGAQAGNFDFVIYEDSDVVRTIPAIQTFNYNGHLGAEWTINQTEFDNVKDSGKAEFYFIINGNQSNILYVNDTSTTPSNFPSVVIKEPILNSKVRVGNLLNFTQFAKDADDDLRIKWTFEDGDEGDWMLNCLTTGNCNTTHIYETSGTKIIEIIAREMTRTNEAINYSQVFAYDKGINVFAVITQPPFGKIFAGEGAILVPFNASTSYVANCTTGACTAGQTCYNVEDLYCYNLNKTTLDIPSKYNLFFDWTFSEGTGRSGYWTGADYNRVVEFNRLFIAPIAHWAKLRVDYLPA